jgi:hypothetical protein
MLLVCKHRITFNISAASIFVTHNHFLFLHTDVVVVQRRAGQSMSVRDTCLRRDATERPADPRASAYRLGSGR